MRGTKHGDHLAEQEAVIAIPTGDILEGSLKPNKLK